MSTKQKAAYSHLLRLLSHSLLLGLFIGTVPLGASDLPSDTHPEETLFQKAFPLQKTMEGVPLSWGVYSDTFFAIQSTVETEELTGEALARTAKRAGMPNEILRMTFGFLPNRKRIVTTRNAFLLYDIKAPAKDPSDKSLPIFCELSVAIDQQPTHHFFYKNGFRPMIIGFDNKELAKFVASEWSRDSILGFLKEQGNDLAIKHVTTSNVALCIFKRPSRKRTFPSIIKKGLLVPYWDISRQQKLAQALPTEALFKELTKDLPRG